MTTPIRVVHNESVVSAAVGKALVLYCEREIETIAYPDSDQNNTNIHGDFYRDERCHIASVFYDRFFVEIQP